MKMVFHLALDCNMSGDEATAHALWREMSSRDLVCWLAS